MRFHIMCEHELCDQDQSGRFLAGAWVGLFVKGKERGGALACLLRGITLHHIPLPHVSRSRRHGGFQLASEH